MRPTVVLALALAAGCAKKSADHDVARPADGPTQVVIAGDGAAAPATKPTPAPAPPPPAPDCKAVNRAIASNVRSAYVAMDAGPPLKKALALWPAAPEACHTGAWYLAAAALIDLGQKELTAGTTKLASAEAALTAALAQPPDVTVLARVALVSALGKGPKLPDDACAKAKTAIGTSTAREDQDRAAYVCARAAIAAGDGKTAKEQLAAIKAPREIVDIELATAQAAKLNKDTKTMKAQAKLAMKLDGTRAMSALVNDADRKAIVGLATQLAAGK